MAALLIIPQVWAERYAPLPPDWWQQNAPALVAYAPDVPRLVAEAAMTVGVDQRLLVTRMQLEQSALTYAWDGSDRTYPGGDRDKLEYLCGVDRTDSGDRAGGWFGAGRQLAGCALRFKHWYRGEDGYGPGAENWLGLREDPRFAPGVPVTRGGVTIVPANQASADCLRYTTSMAAQERLREIGLRYFPQDYAEEESGVIEVRELTLDGYREYLRSYAPPKAILKCTFLHHTWKPNAGTFRGLSTIRGVQTTHRGLPDVTDILCNVYTGPNGMCYTARPPTSNNCGCQAPPERKVFSALPQALRELILRDGISGWRSWPNKYGFSVETVGNFDNPKPGAPPSEDPTTSRAMATSLDVLAEVHRIWSIPVEHCFFHRDTSFKTCPGDRVSREWVHAELRKRLEADTMPEVDVDEWAAPSVERMKAAGIMLGKTADYFGGREPVTRQELAVVADRILAHLEATNE
jgi:hypothetical protein